MTIRGIYGNTDSTELSEHIADTVRHITDTERTNWNNKANPVDIPSDLSELSDTSGLLGSSAVLVADGSGYSLNNDSVGRGTIGTEAISLDYSTNTNKVYGSTGHYSFTTGLNNVNSGGYGFVAGCMNTNTATASFVFGYDNICSGAYATVGGYTNTASADYSTVLGRCGAATAKNSMAVNGGEALHLQEFCVGGASGAQYIGGRKLTNCHHGSLQLTTGTASTDEKRFYADIFNKDSVFFDIASGHGYFLKIHIFAYQSSTGNMGDAIYLARITNQAGTTTLSGLRTLTPWDADTGLGTPTFGISADTTNNALSIAVTPANTTNTYWTARIDFIRITNM